MAKETPIRTIKANSIFRENYYSVIQTKAKLLDPTFLWCELGRGSGKTTHIMGPRLDRVQNAMPGCVIILAAATYKSILDNILPGLMEYFNANYKKGYYFEVGKKPPVHFAECKTFIEDWKHTISFVSGSVVQFVSCDRPESVLGKNAAHLFADELVRIPEDFFYHNIMPALRSDRSLFGGSHYFMGITATSSTPNIEFEESWWQKMKDIKEDKKKHDARELIIMNLAVKLDRHFAAMKDAETRFDVKKAEYHRRWIERNKPLLNSLRNGTTCYLHASSLSNIKILGIDYVKNQLENIKDKTTVNTAIFAITQDEVKDRFFAKFEKRHINTDSYQYKRIDSLSFGDEINVSSDDMRHCDPMKPLLVGYDPGPFSSMVVAQENEYDQCFWCLKNFWAISPEQQTALAKRFDKFFHNHRNKMILLYYDRAANQHNPQWKRGRTDVEGSKIETDAQLLKRALQAMGWSVRLMSEQQGVIYHSQHFKLLNILFSKENEKKLKIRIDANECQELISSIKHSPLKRYEGEVQLDKSSERLTYEEQIMNSTQIATAFMYLLWGKYNNYLVSASSMAIL